jgi:hypothetical protein
MAAGFNYPAEIFQNSQVEELDRILIRSGGLEENKAPQTGCRKIS